MWEVRGAEGREVDLLAYVLAHAAPSAQVFRSAAGPPRVVVFDPTGHGVPDVPAELVHRPAHSWRFLSVERNDGAADGVNRRANDDGDAPEPGGAAG